MPDYVHVLATIKARADRDRREFPWGPAAEVKASAAKWLRARKLDGRAKIRVELSQKSPDVPDFVDSGVYESSGKDDLGTEYAAQWVLAFVEWGRGR